MTSTPHGRKKKAEADSYPPSMPHRIITALDEGSPAGLNIAFEYVDSVRDEGAMTRLALELSVLAAPGPGLITVGLEALVWGHPYRQNGHAWRCGDCPWTGSGYTEQGAVKAAEKHAAEHEGPRPVVTPISPGDSLHARARVWAMALQRKGVKG